MIEVIETCKAFLDIRRPVRIEIKDRIYHNSMGVHWAMLLDSGKIKYHVIKLSIPQIMSDPDTNLETILAHEFVHAWQAEHQPIRKVMHNKSFISKSHELYVFLGDKGFNILPLYNPEVDVT